MPSKKIDAIWIVFGDKEIHPNGGKVIYIDNFFFLKVEIIIRTINSIEFIKTSNNFVSFNIN